MRNSQLHQTLRGFAEESALQLASELAGGAEIPFDLTESRGSGSALYCYRPRTAEFIRSQVGVLGRLPSYKAAAQCLERLGGLEGYLRLCGERRVPADAPERVDAVLRAFLSRAFGETTDFELSGERFTRAYRELEEALFSGRTLSTTLAPVLGLELRSEEVPIGEGLALVRGDAVDDAPDDALWLGAGEAGRPNTLAVITVESRPGDLVPVSRARVRFRRLLTALRLFEDGGFALGPAAWTRIDEGPWRLVALGGSGRPRGATVRVAAEVEDELRAFVNLIGRRRPRGGELAWALARYEMGAERVAPFEGLTDHLLALRALLEPEGPGSGRLARRLAAICAMPEERAGLTQRVAHAISLERAVIAGLAPAEPGVDALAEELADHLRALLRDVLCGHLSGDLCALADGLLVEAAEPGVAGEAGEVDAAYSGAHDAGDLGHRAEPEPDLREAVVAQEAHALLARGGG